MRLNLSAPVELVELRAADSSRTRTIQGLAVPWNVDAVASTGPVRFLPGSLPTDGPAPKLIRDHDHSQPIGIVTERVPTDEGMMFSARISATAAGDEALVLAADGVLDAVSVGVEVLEHTYDRGVLVVSSGRWMELSLVPWGAFPGARVLDVAATDPTTPSAAGHHAERSPDVELVELADPDPDPVEVDPDPELDELSPDPEPEETLTMSDPIAPSPIVAAAPARPVTAASYIADVLSGRLVQAANMDTGDTPGLLPEPVLGPLYDGLRADRPFLSAVGIRTMPNGSGRIFTIPKITQRPTAATQTNEFDPLSSQALIVSAEQVTRTTVGGWVDVSEQDLDWTDPAALQIIIDQMARAYARETEEIACGILEAGGFNTDPITSWTDADEVMSAVFDAQAAIVSATGSQPSHLFLAPDRFADLAKLQSTAGDFLFPSLNPSSAFGSLSANSYAGTPAGLSLVVSPQFTAGTFIVGNPDGLRFFELQKGAVSVNQPSTLSVRLAWRGYFAGLVLDDAKFVGLVDAV